MVVRKSIYFPFKTSFSWLLYTILVFGESVRVLGSLAGWMAFCLNFHWNIPFHLLNDKQLLLKNKCLKWSLNWSPRLEFVIRQSQSASLYLSPSFLSLVCRMSWRQYWTATNANNNNSISRSGCQIHHHHTTEHTHTGIPIRIAWRTLKYRTPKTICCYIECFRMCPGAEN